MDEKKWSVNEMIRYARSVYSLPEGSDENGNLYNQAFGQKIRRTLSTEGYCRPSVEGGRIRYLVPESIAKYVVEVMLKEYFEKNSLKDSQAERLSYKKYYRQIGERLNPELHQEMLSDLSQIVDVRNDGLTDEAYERMREDWGKPIWMVDERWNMRREARFDLIAEETGYRYRPDSSDCPPEPLNDIIEYFVDKQIEKEYEEEWVDSHRVIPDELLIIKKLDVMVRAIFDKWYYLKEDVLEADLKELYKKKNLNNQYETYHEGYEQLVKRVGDYRNYVIKKR